MTEFTCMRQILSLLVIDHVFVGNWIMGSMQIRGVIIDKCISASGCATDVYSSIQARGAKIVFASYTSSSKPVTSRLRIKFVDRYFKSGYMCCYFIKEHRCPKSFLKLFS